MWQAAVAGGATQGLGNILSGVMSNEYAKGMQREAHDFAEFMYKHRYQFTMEDMKKAGINPLYMTKGGMAGGTPGGTGGSAASVDIGKGVISSAKQAAAFEQELKNLEATGENIVSDTAAKNQSILTNEAIEDKEKELASYWNSQTERTIEEANLLKLRQGIEALREVEHSTSAKQAELKKDMLDVPGLGHIMTAIDWLLGRNIGTGSGSSVPTGPRVKGRRR